MKTMERDDIIWLAGLFEGEGYMHGARGSSFQLGVSMVDRDVIHRCQHVTGLGSVIPRPRTRPEWQDQWTWLVSNRRDVARLLCAMAPLLGERRRRQVVKVTDAIQDSWRRRPYSRINPAPCGTAAGYDRHRVAGEKACRPCKDALAQRARDQRVLLVCSQCGGPKALGRGRKICDACREASPRYKTTGWM